MAMSYESRSTTREIFVFASSVKVHGEASPAGRGLREDDPLDPQRQRAPTASQAGDDAG